MYTNGFGPITGWSLRLLVWLFEEVLISKRMLPQVDGTFLPGESFENPDISNWFKLMKSIADGVPPPETCHYDEALEISDETGIQPNFVFIVYEFALQATSRTVRANLKGLAEFPSRSDNIDKPLLSTKDKVFIALKRVVGKQCNEQLLIILSHMFDRSRSKD